MSSTENTLIDFIRAEILEDPDFELSATDEILLDDIVDSMGVMRLVAFIEDRGNTAIPAEHVTIDNFATIRQLADYLFQRDIAFD